MKKYRIKETIIKGFSTYTIQQRISFFFWEDVYSSAWVNFFANYNLAKERKLWLELNGNVKYKYHY